MKKYALCMLAAVFLSSCATPEMLGPFQVAKPYGGRAPYGEGTHPGIDFDINTGTPIIAVSKGKVVLVKDEGVDGIAVVVLHGKHFRSVYAHLSTVVVQKDQWLKRGQFIGLSGDSNNYGRIGYAHLHFGISKIGPGDTHNYSLSYDPKTFWLGGQPQCFDPKTDYSAYSQKDMTIPVACGDYAKALIAENKRTP